MGSVILWLGDAESEYHMKVKATSQWFFRIGWQSNGFNVWVFFKSSGYVAQVS
jgi:hypothetical protein